MRAVMEAGESNVMMDEKMVGYPFCTDDSDNVMKPGPLIG